MPYINCRKLCVSEARRARNAGFLTPEQRRGQAARDRQLHEAVFGLKDLTSPVTIGRIRSMTLMVKDNSWPPVKIAFQNKINDWFPAIVHLLFHRSSSKFYVLVSSCTRQALTATLSSKRWLWFYWKCRLEIAGFLSLCWRTAPPGVEFFIL